MELYSLSPVFWGLACLGVILTGISKSGFAGGAGVLAVPLLALVMPVPQAAILMLPLLLVMDAKAISYYIRHCPWQELRAIVPASLIGIVAGGLAFGLLDPVVLQVGLGGLCIVFALWHKLAPVLGGLPGAAWIWGSLSGFTSTLIHAGGPPINIYLISRKFPKEVWLAIASVFFAVMNATKIVPYVLTGAWEMTLLVTSCVLVPVAIAGTWLGKRIQMVISEQQFMLVCRGLLLASGAMLVLKALVG